MEIPAGPRGLSGGQFSPGIYKDLTAVLRFCLQAVKRVPVLVGPCEIPCAAWEQGYPNFLSPSFLWSLFGRKMSFRRHERAPTSTPRSLPALLGLPGVMGRVLLSGPPEMARVGREGEAFKDPNQKEAAKEFWKNPFWPRQLAWSSSAITSPFCTPGSCEQSELTALPEGLSLSLGVGFCGLDLLLLCSRGFVCNLYLCGSVHVHAWEFDAESSIYVCVCVVFGVSACDVCGFVSVFWVWVCS